MIPNPFRRRNDDLRSRLDRLEEQASATSPAYRGQYLSRAGDLCIGEGYRERALDFWGRAVDAYLESARPEAAAAACRKIIQHVPEVVRARRTLALLSIGLGRIQEALRHAEAYVHAARRAGRSDLAVKQLRLMARVSEDPEFEAGVAELLAELGGGPGASPARRPVAEDDAAPENEARSFAGSRRWSSILEAARTSPEELEGL